MKQRKWLAVLLAIMLSVSLLTGCSEEMLEEMLVEMGFDAERWETLEAEMSEIENYATDLKSVLTPAERIAFDNRLEELMEERFGDLEAELEERMSSMEADIEQRLEREEITETEAMELMMEAMAQALMEMMKVMEEAIPFMQEALETLIIEFDIDVTTIPERVKELILIVMGIDRNQAMVNQQTVLLDQAPVIIGGRTLVPLRFIGEALGATVDWDGDLRQVTYRTPENWIILTIDEPIAFVNGIPQTLDVSPTILNGRTMVPVRFVSESMGFQTDWIPESRQVVVTNQ